MKRITIIDGHPDPADARLIHALADRYAYAARAAGHEVRCIKISSIDFPVLRKVDDFYERSAPESLQNAQNDIASADHIAFFYPLWHGSMPALLKAFIEQTFRPGFAMAYGGERRFPKPLFKGKSARVVVTMGMPAFIYRLYFGGYGVKSFERSVLRLCGISPVSETLLGMTGTGCEKRSSRRLDLMAVLAERDAEPERWRRQEAAIQVVRALALLGFSYAAWVLASSTSRAWFGSPERRRATSLAGEIEQASEASRGSP